MKKITILLLSLVLTPTLFADVSKCSKVNSVHCVYYTGDKSKNNNGRYIKITNNSISRIRCTKADTFDFMPQKFGNGSKIKRQVSVYSQCFDAICKNSLHLGTDKFTIGKNGKEYISKPRIFEVHLLNYGKVCS